MRRCVAVMSGSAGAAAAATVASAAAAASATVAAPVAAAAVAAPARILIVGGGPTAALTAAMLKEAHANVTITLMDKGRGLGGRMSTHRATGAGTGARADTGAQYLSELSPRSGRWYDQLQKAGVLQPILGPILSQRSGQKALRNYVAPAGVSSVVRHIAAESKAAFVPSRKVVSIDLADPEAGGGAGAAAHRRLWTVRADPSTKSSPGAPRSVSKPGAAGAAGAAGDSLLTDSYHAVVLTCPVPQVLAITGDLPALLEGAGVSDALRAVTYSQRYSLALYFGPGDWAAVSRALPYAGKYFDKGEDDVIRFISYDSLKRGAVPREFLPPEAGAGPAGAPSAASAAARPPETCPAVIVHTGVDFGRMYVDTDPTLVEPVILEHLKRLHPELPEPVETRCHRWRYSQVMHGYAGPEPFGPPVEDAPPAAGTLDESHRPLPEAADAADAAAAAASAAVSGATSDVSGAARMSGEVPEPAPTPLGGGAAAGAASSAAAAAAAAAGHVAAVRRAGALLVVDDPPLILAGDAFSGSHFDGCVESAEKAAQLILESLAKNAAAAKNAHSG